MTSFYVDLNEASSKKPRIRRLLIFGATICLGFILFSLSIFLFFRSSLEWFFLVAGLYLVLYLYYAWVTYKTSLFVKADTVCFEYKFGSLKGSKSAILWDVVSKVKLGPAYVAFYKKSGRRKMVQLNWLPYSKVVEIKESLIKMCEFKNIEYQKVDLIKYTKKIKKLK
ncbi:MAG: hypothetical protein HXX16_07140 [Bacteroidales bacterium]|nr:hypothetical protein [Bacteroidales bacterium]